MKKRLSLIWNSARFLWKTISRTVKMLIFLVVITALGILILSPDREFWLVICGVLLVAGFLSAYVVFRLLSKIR